MPSAKILLTGSLIFLNLLIKGQADSNSVSINSPEQIRSVNGFLRAGFYAGRDPDRDKAYFSGAFSDICVRFNLEDGKSYRVFADLRYRYGAEFNKPVSTVQLREGFVKVYGSKWDLTAGQQIVNWGSTDFINPVSRLDPRNYIARSPDREDMDLGNLMADFKWFPSGFMDLGAALVPFYKPSVLIIDPMPLPGYVTIDQNKSLVADSGMFSYGLKATFHLQGIDFGISWFDGFDPMPGIELSKFSVDLSGNIPSMLMHLETKPYRNRVAGVDFDAVAGNFGIRGEATWAMPKLSYKTFEYVPLNEINWVAGLSCATGIFRFDAEYSGKAMPGFTASPVEPVIGNQGDFSSIVMMLTDPLFDLEEYVRQQVAAFNRLYNYQLEKFYHSAGFRMEASALYGKLVPAMYSMYNFTSRDFLIIPELRYKPTDGLTLIAGAEYYSGPSGSLYDIVDEFMNSFYMAIRVDF